MARKKTVASQDANNVPSRFIYLLGENDFLDRVGTTVLAGYNWARNRGFDPRYDPAVFEADRNGAIQWMREALSGQSLASFLESLINAQAEVIWIRKVNNGYQGVQPPEEYDRDRQEAERFVAFLLFNEIVRKYLEEGVWPRLGIVLGEEVSNLLAKLSVEDYGRIGGYLEFSSRAPDAAHGAHTEDFQKAMIRLANIYTTYAARKRARGRRPSGAGAAEPCDPFAIATNIMEFLEKCIALSGAAVEKSVAAKQTVRKSEGRGDAAKDTGAAKSTRTRIVRKPAAGEKEARVR